MLGRGRPWGLRERRGGGGPGQAAQGCTRPPARSIWLVAGALAVCGVLGYPAFPATQMEEELVQVDAWRLLRPLPVQCTCLGVGFTPVCGHTRTSGACDCGQPPWPARLS